MPEKTPSLPRIRERRLVARASGGHTRVEEERIRLLEDYEFDPARTGVFATTGLPYDPVDDGTPLSGWKPVPPKDR